MGGATAPVQTFSASPRHRAVTPASLTSSRTPPIQIILQTGGRRSSKKIQPQMVRKMEDFCCIICLEKKKKMTDGRKHAWRLGFCARRSEAAEDENLRSLNFYRLSSPLGASRLHHTCADRWIVGACLENKTIKQTECIFSYLGYVLWSRGEIAFAQTTRRRRCLAGLLGWKWRINEISGLIDSTTTGRMRLTFKSNVWSSCVCYFGRITWNNVI